MYMYNVVSRYYALHQAAIIDNLHFLFVCRKFQHDNLVKLYGVCIKQGAVYIITELMVNGKM